MAREIVIISVEDAQRCVEDKLFELICTCNIKTLVASHQGIITLPPKLAGKPLEEAKAECGICLEVVDGRRQYLLVFFTLKIGLRDLAEIVATACRGNVLSLP